MWLLEVPTLLRNWFSKNYEYNQGSALPYPWCLRWSLQQSSYNCLVGCAVPSRPQEPDNIYFLLIYILASAIWYDGVQFDCIYHDNQLLVSLLQTVPCFNICCQWLQFKWMVCHLSFYKYRTLVLLLPLLLDLIPTIPSIGRCWHQCTGTVTSAHEGKMVPGHYYYIAWWWCIAQNK